jgi:hypothetical protein
LKPIRHWRMYLMWTSGDIKFDDIDYDATDHPVVTIRMTTPSGLIEVMAEVTADGRALRLTRLHVSISRRTKRDRPRELAAGCDNGDGEHGL